MQNTKGMNVARHKKCYLESRADARSVAKDERMLRQYYKQTANKSSRDMTKEDLFFERDVWTSGLPTVKKFEAELVPARELAVAYKVCPAPRDEAHDNWKMNRGCKRVCAPKASQGRYSSLLPVPEYPYSPNNKLEEPTLWDAVREMRRNPKFHTPEYKARVARKRKHERNER